MSIFTWWRDLHHGLKRLDELKAVEREKIVQLQNCDNPEAASICLNEITINVKRGDTDKTRKNGGVV